LESLGPANHTALGLSLILSHHPLSTDIHHQVVRDFKFVVVGDEALVIVVFVSSGVGNKLKVELDFGVEFLESFPCLVFDGSVVLYYGGRVPRSGFSDWPAQ
jgi:hypothetical protein